MNTQSLLGQGPQVEIDPELNVLRVRHRGMVDYEPVWQEMQEFTNSRDEFTPDEVWILQHPPVFTQGQSGKAEHVLAPGDIPVVQVDRGGQVTYHGPGQIVAYLMIDIKRRKIGVRALVNSIEEAIIRVLAGFGVVGQRREGAPGIYVDEAKIAALGLRVRRGCSFHGLAFNINMDLEPFSRINPCGFQGLAVTQLSDLAEAEMEPVENELVAQIARALSYSGVAIDKELPVNSER